MKKNTIIIGSESLLKLYKLSNGINIFYKSNREMIGTESTSWT
jgi:hypothetical protein